MFDCIFFLLEGPAWSQEMQFVAHLELNFCWKCCMDEEQLTDEVKMRGCLYSRILFYCNNQNNLVAGWMEITRKLKHMNSSLQVGYTVSHSW